MDIEPVDLVRNKATGDVVLMVGPRTAAALAVLLHLVDDDPRSSLSPHLKPLMQLMDKKLIGYKGAMAG